MLTPSKTNYDQPRQHAKKQRHYFANKGPFSQSYGFSSSHLWTKGLSRVFSNTTVQKHQFSSAQLSSQSNSHIHTWLLEKTIALYQNGYWLNKPVCFTCGNVLLSYVNETMYLLWYLPFFNIHVNCFMARDDSSCVNAISKCMLWVQGLVPLSEFWDISFL